ncbi:MAG: tetratricopeptide repeat protein [Thermodesulfobacteriota bacterium]
MPSRTILLLLILSFLHCPIQWGAASAASPSREKLLTIAIGAFNDKFYGFAENQFETYIESYPRSPNIDWVYYLLGRTYYLQGKILEAKEVFLKVVREFPSFQHKGNALFWLARTWLELGNNEEAVKYYREFVLRHHKNEHLSEAYFDLGNIYVQWKRFIEAEYYLKELMSYPVAEDTLIQAQYFLGLIFFNQGRYREAEDQLDKVIINPASSRKPYFREALFLLAEIRLRLSHFEKARQAYFTFSRLFPKDTLSPDVLFGLGWSQYRSGDVQGAIQTYLQFKKRFPDSKLLPEVRLRMGEMYLQQEDYTEALEEFKGVVQDFPKSPTFGKSLLNMGWCYLNVGQFEEAAKISHKILQLPTHEREKSLSQLILGEVNFHENRYSEALPYYFNLINIPEYRENALFKMAKCYFHEGKFKEALTNIEILTLEYPDFKNIQELLFIRGEASSKLEDFDLAIHSYQQIIKANKTGKWTTHALFNLGKIYILRRDVEKVKEVFHRIIEDFPGSPLSPLAAFRLGTIYFNEGDEEKALDTYTLALKTDDKRVLAESHFRRGEIYFKQANYSKAMENFMAIEGNFKGQTPWYELAQFEVANIQRKLGKITEAKATYKTVLKHSKDPELKGIIQKMLDEMKMEESGQ